jgi:hypothetical protein
MSGRREPMSLKRLRSFRRDYNRSVPRAPHLFRSFQFGHVGADNAPLRADYAGTEVEHEEPARVHIDVDDRLVPAAVAHDQQRPDAVLARVRKGPSPRSSTSAEAPSSSRSRRCHRKKVGQLSSQHRHGRRLNRALLDPRLPGLGCSDYRPQPGITGTAPAGVTTRLLAPGSSPDCRDS